MKGNHTDRVAAVVAGVFGITRSAVTDDLEFRVFPQWDSLRHVELMLALEEEMGREIEPETFPQLTSVAAIRRYVESADPVVRMLGGGHPDAPIPPRLPRGLSGVEVDRTEISHIDAERSRLTYRGYDIDELVESSTFEETAFLLLHGELPTREELTAFEDELRATRDLPDPVRPLIRELAGTHPVDVLRTAVSALGALDPDRNDRSLEAMRRAGVRLIARIPAILSEVQAARTGRDLPGDRASHARSLLAGIGNGPVEATDPRTLDRCLILLAEHGSNASAFAGRVAIGTGSDLHAAVTGAIAAFSGQLHGGAIEGVTEMVRDIGEPSHAAAWVRATRSRREPVLGLGHRVYRTEDPRARHLRRMARRLSQRSGDATPFQVLEAVRSAMRPHSRFGVDVNVDFYAGLALTHLGIPPDMLTSVFAAARVAGWVAQCLEQRADNVLIRPLLRYEGSPVRAYPSIDARRRAEPEGGAGAHGAG